MLTQHDLTLAENLRKLMLDANASDVWQVQSQYERFPEMPGVYGHIHNALETLLRVHGLDAEKVIHVLIDSGESVQYAIEYVRDVMSDDMP